MSGSEIKSITGRRVWDSRGRPTVEADVILADGSFGRGIAPAGASRGMREAVDLRDGGARFGGFDVTRALRGIKAEISPALCGMDARNQAAIDHKMIALDGTPTKSRLGGNALVAVSIAVLHAAAANAKKPLWAYVAQGNAVSLPVPEIQIFGGGAHAGRRIDIQDLMIVAPQARSFEEALAVTAEVYLAAGKIMSDRGLLQGVADEGGFWPAFATNEEALDTLVQAIEKAGFTPGHEAAVSLDIAASEFGKDGMYTLALEGQKLDRDAMCEMMVRWCERYPIISIEDPLAEDDTEGLIRFTKAVGKKVQVIGDDYLVTNAERVKLAATEGSVNATLIKLNQAGTVTETKAALDESRKNGMGMVVSARSGETEDVTITHLATGWNAGQLKVGSFSRSERMAKWNEALRIEENLGKQAVMAKPFASFMASAK